MSEVSGDIAAAAIRRSSIRGCREAQLRRLQDLQLETRRAQQQILGRSASGRCRSSYADRSRWASVKASRLLDTYLARFQTSATHVDTGAWGWPGSACGASTSLRGQEWTGRFRPTGRRVICSRCLCDAVARNTRSCLSAARTDAPRWCDSQERRLRCRRKRSGIRRCRVSRTL